MSISDHSAFERISRFLEEQIRPRVQGDGGDLELTALEGNALRIKALNECSRCPLTTNCYKEWLRSRINTEFNAFYDVEIQIQKPYFWDK